jgi:hypothetical protein
MEMFLDKLIDAISNPDMGISLASDHTVLPYVPQLVSSHLSEKYP